MLLLKSPIKTKEGKIYQGIKSDFSMRAVYLYNSESGNQEMIRLLLKEAEKINYRSFIRHTDIKSFSKLINKLGYSLDPRTGPTAKKSKNLQYYRSIVQGRKYYLLKSDYMYYVFVNSN